MLLTEMWSNILRQSAPFWLVWGSDFSLLSTRAAWRGGPFRLITEKIGRRVRSKKQKKESTSRLFRQSYLSFTSIVEYFVELLWKSVKHEEIYWKNTPARQNYSSNSRNILYYSMSGRISRWAAVRQIRFTESPRMKVHQFLYTGCRSLQYPQKTNI